LPFFLQRDRIVRVSVFLHPHAFLDISWEIRSRGASEISLYYWLLSFVARDNKFHCICPKDLSVLPLYKDDITQRWYFLHTGLLGIYKFWLRKYEIYDIKIIPLDSYSKELSNGIIFIAYTIYFVNKLMVNFFLKIHNCPITQYGGNIRPPLIRRVGKSKE
jgi:hypothetical protein